MFVAFFRVKLRKHEFRSGFVDKADRAKKVVSILGRNAYFYKGVVPQPFVSKWQEKIVPTKASIMTVQNTQDRGRKGAYF